MASTTLASGEVASYSLRALPSAYYLSVAYRHYADPLLVSRSMCSKLMLTKQQPEAVPTIEISLDSSMDIGDALGYSTAQDELESLLAEAADMVSIIIQIFYMYLHDNHYNPSGPHGAIHQLAVEAGYAKSDFPYLSRANLSVQGDFQRSALKKGPVDFSGHFFKSFTPEQWKAVNAWALSGVRGLYYTGLVRVYVHTGPNAISHPSIYHPLRFLLYNLATAVDRFPGSHKVKVIVKQDARDPGLARNLLDNIYPDPDDQPRETKVNENMFHWRFYSSPTDHVDETRMLPNYPDIFLPLNSRLALETEV